MPDAESEFVNYENARDLEGGPHPGRSRPSNAVLWAAVGAVALLLLGLAALALIPA